MSKSIKALIALGFVTVVAACSAPQEEVIIVEPAPIESEAPMGKM